MIFPEPPTTAKCASMPPLRASYEAGRLEDLLAGPDVLAVIGFGPSAGSSNDPRYLNIGLEQAGSNRYEVWRGVAPVRSGVMGNVRWSSDDTYLFFAVEIDEAESGGIDQAAEKAYSRICNLLDEQRLEGGTRPHILRLWNYMDAINEGEGDDERYRQFCCGRARGITPAARNGYSAATAIGRRDGVRVLQVYGLAARQAGVAVENPRQVSAWSYPRQYGPVAPTFARATRTPAEQLLVSGTAAVVGHASVHLGDTFAQFEETLRNLQSLLDAAGSEIARRGLAASLLKVYLRDPTEAAAIEQRMRERCPPQIDCITLFGDICRSDLRIEIDGMQI
ncbi:pteridine-dependent deoxygenase [Dokdonella sp.]|uniref:chorismate transformation enzyme, FkbO/Hyg5 family n=1 Tax=Dokdonella sp. TaxID=2291710 RepID=UPI0035286EB6